MTHTEKTILWILDFLPIKAYWDYKRFFLFRWSENCRYWYAGKLSDKYPHLCWANLAMWTMGFEDYLESIEHQSCTPKQGAYCGKCEYTGRLFRPCPSAPAPNRAGCEVLTLKMEIDKNDN